MVGIYLARISNPKIVSPAVNAILSWKYGFQQPEVILLLVSLICRRLVSFDC
jgi:hypothetical protein